MDRIDKNFHCHGLPVSNKTNELQNNCQKNPKHCHLTLHVGCVDKHTYFFTISGETKLHLMVNCEIVMKQKC